MINFIVSFAGSELKYGALVTKTYPKHSWALNTFAWTIGIGIGINKMELSYIVVE